MKGTYPEERRERRKPSRKIHRAGESDGRNLHEDGRPPKGRNLRRFEWEENPDDDLFGDDVLEEYVEDDPPSYEEGEEPD